MTYDIDSHLSARGVPVNDITRLLEESGLKVFDFAYFGYDQGVWIACVADPYRFGFVIGYYYPDKFVVGSLDINDFNHNDILTACAARDVLESDQVESEQFYFFDAIIHLEDLVEKHNLTFDQMPNGLHRHS